jgi:hypothetical protein
MKIDKNLMKELDKKFSINPYDALVRGFLDNTSIAQSFLEQSLPKYILSQIDFNTLTVEKDSFVHRDMQNKMKILKFAISIGASSGVLRKFTRQIFNQYGALNATSRGVLNPQP